MQRRRVSRAAVRKYKQEKLYDIILLIITAYSLFSKNTNNSSNPSDSNNGGQNPGLLNTISSILGNSGASGTSDGSQSPGLLNTINSILGNNSASSTGSANSTENSNGTNPVRRNRVTVTNQNGNETPRVVYHHNVDSNENGASGNEGYRGILDIIKRAYHGVDITVTLTNNREISGNVISVYNNILVLRSNGVLNYINSNAIVSFS